MYVILGVLIEIIIIFEQVSSEASLARGRVEELLEELDDAREDAQRSHSRASELQNRQSEGR